MTTVQGSLVPSLFRTTVIRADNTLLKCLRLLYFHGGCARASLSDFLPSAAHFRYFTLCCMHASPTGLPHRKRICTLLHGGTVAEVETHRETDAESLNPGHLDPLDVICIEFDSISGNFEKSCFWFSWFRYSILSDGIHMIFFILYLYYMIFYEMEFMMQNIIKLLENRKEIEYCYNMYNKIFNIHF